MISQHCFSGRVSTSHRLFFPAWPRTPPLPSSTASTESACPQNVRACFLNTSQWGDRLRRGLNTRSSSLTRAGTRCHERRWSDHITTCSSTPRPLAGASRHARKRDVNSSRPGASRIRSVKSASRISPRRRIDSFTTNVTTCPTSPTAVCRRMTGAARTSHRGIVETARSTAARSLSPGRGRRARAPWPWRSISERLYRNWLTSVVQGKD